MIHAVSYLYDAQNENTGKTDMEMEAGLLLASKKAFLDKTVRSSLAAFSSAH